MERLYADLMLKGWRRITKRLTVTVDASASDATTLTTDGKRPFMVTELSCNATSTFTFGVVSNVQASIAIVASGTPGAAFFGGSYYTPVPFPRRLEPSEQWTFTITDTSVAENTVDIVVHGFTPPEGVEK